MVREQAFAREVREHEAVLVAIARRLCANAADADDLVQETYEKALRGLDRYEERGNLRSWLASIMNNLFIDRCRRAKRTPQVEGIENLQIATPEPPTPPAWAHVTAAQIRAALDRIGPEFRSVYELHASGRSYDEIARELGIPKATVGTRLIRARKKLKEILLEGLP
jgi:RNA polymerase sigma-70 factor (ECF subfamily)